MAVCAGSWLRCLSAAAALWISAPNATAGTVLPLADYTLPLSGNAGNAHFFWILDSDFAAAITPTTGCILLDGVSCSSDLLGYINYRFYLSAALYKGTEFDQSDYIQPLFGFIQQLHLNGAKDNISTEINLHIPAGETQLIIIFQFFPEISDERNLVNGGGQAFVIFDDGVLATPIPASFPLFASNLGALVLLARSRKRKRIPLSKAA
jgi:hypothetical protein